MESMVCPDQGNLMSHPSHITLLSIVSCHIWSCILSLLVLFCLLHITCSLLVFVFQVLLSKFLLKTIHALHGEAGDVRKQRRVLVSAVAILCISHQLNMLNQFVATDCVLLAEILKLAASREADGDGGKCSAYNKLIRCNLGYTHIHIPLSLLF